MDNKEKILNYLSITRRGEWVREGNIHGIDTEWGWIGYRGERDVRDLIESGQLEKSMDGKFRIVRARTTANEIIDRINAIPPRKIVQEEQKEVNQDRLI